jgi:hypothetical protein
MGLTATTIAIAVILLASNFTTINAQQQFNQPGEIENGTTEATGTTTTFQSTNDSFSIEVPQGWVIQDIDNTGSTLLEESNQGYGILAQLCPEEQQQQGTAALSNASGGSTNSISSINASSCQGAQEVIHIIRYPNLETRTQLDNNITTYHLQKLEEVGYRGIQTVNSTDITSDLIDPQTNGTITTLPAKFVEMTYSTASAPNETRRGYFVLTSTNATGPNLQLTKGYSVLYEGSSTAAEITTTAASLPPPPAVVQVFDSFELIAAPEVAQAAETDDNGGDDDDNGGDDDDNGGDDDDNGGDDDDNGGDDDDNGGDDDDNGDNGEGGEGEGGDGGEGNPNEFDDCVVPPGRDPGDVGC